MDMYKSETIVLCGANSYQQKYYLNEEFQKLPQTIKDELQIMCVTFTEEIGGVLTLEFEPDGRLIFRAMADDSDYYYDEISSGLKIRQMQNQKQELLASLELFYKVFFLKQENPL